MIKRFSGSLVSGVLLASCSAGPVPSADGDVGDTDGAIVRATSLGGRNEVVMVYGMVGFDANNQPVYRTCSGAYFAPRVVATAAHCLQNVFANQVFVYYGDNFTQDLAQLTPSGWGRVPPPVGQPSFWAQAESFEQHPNWVATDFYPDLGMIYLDRKPPFDPLPLARFRLDNTWLNRQVTISGWGADTVTGPTTARAHGCSAPV